MEVLYIRHGQAESNIYHPDMKVGSDLGLTAEGERQAHSTGEYLARLALKGEIGPIDGIYSSQYLRAKQTADIIARALNQPYSIDTRLQEIQKGDWHDMRVEDVINLEGKVSADIQHHFRPPKGENWFDVAHRMTAFVEEAEEKGHQSLVVVSHNHPIEIAIGKLTGVDATEWKDNPVDNASISRVVKNGDYWEVDENLSNFRPFR